MAKIFDLRKIVDTFIEENGTDLNELDKRTNYVINELSTAYNIEKEVYKAYTYQYFVEQKMYQISKEIRQKASLEKDKYILPMTWGNNINAIHRFCCKAKDAEKNMYEKLNNLHYLEMMNIGGGEVCI